MLLNLNNALIAKLEGIRDVVHDANSVEELKSAILDLVTVIVDEAQEDLETEE